MTSLKDLRLFTTEEHACSYLTGEKAKTLFLDPEFEVDQEFHTHLSEIGFRRSGGHMYRPHCTHCQKCLPCRVLVNDFVPGKRFRRILNKNADLSVKAIDSIADEEFFQLYCQYINTRHRYGDMYPATLDQYQSFLVKGCESTIFFEIRHQGRLIAVMISDKLDNGLSAVFTFYDLDYAKRSLGNFGILWQIEEAKRRNMDHLYLGYYIKECGKMNYKTQFRPIELLRSQSWIKLT